MKKKKINKKMKKFDFRNFMIPITILLILIVSSFTLGIAKGIIIFLVLNAIYFIPQLVKKLNKDKVKSKKKTKKMKKTKKKKILKIILLVILVCFILGIISVIAFCSYIVINAPEFDEKLLYSSDPSIVLDKNGKEIFKLGTERRITISYDELPEILIDAIVATEDSRFFEHNGVDWARFLKASAYQLMGKDEAGGASTLTMQLSKNNYTSSEASGIQGIIRKFTDVYVSMFKIEKKYTKEQIFEFYINSQFLGKNAYGVEQVALNYFGKSAKDLNVAEAAMIAGLFQAPGRYDPYKNPEATEARRQTVLKLMLRHEYITKDEYEIAKQMTVEKIVIPKEKSSYSSSEISEYQGFIDTVVEEVQEKTGFNPYSTPMIIYTTLDTDIQKYINKIMKGENYDWENDKARAGISIIDVKTGSIVALGSNRDGSAIDQFNYATDITNQIGSTAKPLYDYGPAIEYNNWSTYHILVDEPITYSNGTTINNWNGAFEGFETMRTALAGSRNIPALKAFKENNKAKVIEFVTNLGLTPEIYSCSEGYRRDKKVCINNEDPNDVVDAKKDTTLHEAHSIGGYNGESPVSLSAAYAAFANKGTYNEPHTFTKIIYQESKEEYENEYRTTKVMGEDTAYMISDMLATTAVQAMGRYYNINGIRYAAKTGTTNYDEATLKAHNLYYSNAVNDLWTVGFNTEYAIGVWYGYDNVDEEYHNVLSSGQHERLFQAVGKKVFSNGNKFSKPSNVVEVEIESECAEEMYPSAYTPASLRRVELFKADYTPTKTSPRFEKLNEISGLKATQNDNIVNLSWNNISAPEVNSEKYLKDTFSKVFSSSGYLNSYVQGRLNYNNNVLGKFGYRIYKKSEDGTLIELGFVTTNKYEYEISSRDSGNTTFVVRTSYSNFKDNMSDGKSIKLNIQSFIPIIPDDEDDKDDEEKPTIIPGEETEKEEN